MEANTSGKQVDHVISRIPIFFKTPRAVIYKKILQQFTNCEKPRKFIIICYFPAKVLSYYVNDLGKITFKIILSICTRALWVKPQTYILWYRLSIQGKENYLTRSVSYYPYVLIAKTIKWFALKIFKLTLNVTYISWFANQGSNSHNFDNLTKRV